MERWFLPQNQPFEKGTTSESSVTQSRGTNGDLPRSPKSAGLPKETQMFQREAPPRAFSSSPKARPRITERCGAFALLRGSCGVSRPPKIGIEGALELLRGLDSAAQERILSEIAEREPELHRTLQERLPDFDRILKIPAQELRSLYFKSDPDLWTEALRGASPSVVAHVLTSLPERARRELEDRIISLGPIPRSRAEVARARIAKLFAETP